jgi:two-component system, OmpR family, response regulator MtrA
MSDFQGRKVSQAVQFGEMSLDFGTMELYRAGRPIGITLGEFKVLKFLVSRPRIVVSRQKLISSAWPKRRRSTHRTVDNCIAKLRQKIESNPNRPVFLQTVRGVGYKFVPQEDSHPLPQSLTNRGREAI